MNSAQTFQALAKSPSKIPQNPFTDQSVDLKESMSACVNKQLEHLRQSGQYHGLDTMKQRLFIKEAKQNLKKNRHAVQHLIKTKLTNQERFQEEHELYKRQLEEGRRAQRVGLALASQLRWEIDSGEAEDAGTAEPDAAAAALAKDRLQLPTIETTRLRYERL